MRNVALLSMLLTAAAPAPGAVGAPIDAAHPILGTWKLSMPDGICTETYHFRKDGTSVVLSGQEVSESAFEITALPSPLGYYRMVDRITRDNGKPDCAGEIMKVGKEATTYIRLHPSGSMIIFCDAESLNSCIGPLERIPDQEM